MLKMILMVFVIMLIEFFISILFLHGADWNSVVFDPVLFLEVVKKLVVLLL